MPSTIRFHLSIFCFSSLTASYFIMLDDASGSRWSSSAMSLLYQSTERWKWNHSNLRFENRKSERDREIGEKKSTSCVKKTNDQTNKWRVINRICICSEKTNQWNRKLTIVIGTFIFLSSLCFWLLLSLSLFLLFFCYCFSDSRLMDASECGVILPTMEFCWL